MGVLFRATGKVSWKKGHCGWDFEEYTGVYQADDAFINLTTPPTPNQILCTNLTPAGSQGEPDVDSPTVVDGLEGKVGAGGDPVEEHGGSSEDQ